jgi:hypothetical protein
MFLFGSLALVLTFALVGLVIAYAERPRPVGVAEAAPDRSGWIYFVGEPEGESPIKVGMSSKEPSLSRFTELTTMSPVPLKIFFKAPVSDRYATEAALHRELGPYRSHGEWFDRDAALAWADHLRGEW